MLQSAIITTAWFLVKQEAKLLLV